MKKPILILFMAAFIFSCGSSEEKESNNDSTSTSENKNEATTETEVEKKMEEEVPETSKPDANYIDGTPIEFVVLGETIWTGKNLMVTKFNDGTPIRMANSAKEWKDAYKKGEPAYAYVDFNESSSVGPFGYGVLFNGFVYSGEKKICPKGWHLPTPSEMEALNNAYKTKQLKATFGWKPNTETGTVGGSDEFGFTLLAAGAINDRGMFGMKDANANIATGVMEDGKHIIYQADYIIAGFKKIKSSPGDGIPCRCILDDPSQVESLNKDYKKTGPVYYSLPDAE